MLVPDRTVTWRSPLASLLLAAAMGCSADESVGPPVAPAPALTGDLLVLVASDREDDAVDVAITISGPETNVTQNARTVRLRDRTPGMYTIEVSVFNDRTHARTGCRVSEGSLRTAEVLAGKTTRIDYSLRCRSAPS